MTDEFPDLICPRMADIRTAICQRYRISMTELLSAQRSRFVARPRQIGMFLARKMTLRSLPEIGQHFGGRDHTTVIHATRKIEALCAIDAEIAEDVLLLELSLTATARNRLRSTVFA